MIAKIKLMGAIVVSSLLLGCQGTDKSYTDWGYYLGGLNSNQYSPLEAIDKANVARLEIAWTYTSGDADSLNRSQIQCNPLVIDGVLYGTSPTLKLFALEADSGEELWRFDPFDGIYALFGMGVNRGLTYWSEGDRRRIYFSAGDRLYCVDATDGTLVDDFGEAGSINLKKGLGDIDDRYFVVSNTPGVLFEDKLIIGSRVSESMYAAPGSIRAFNIHTGALEWTFHTIPKPGEYGYETWPADAHQRIGGANAWAGMSLDVERATVYVPTGSAAFDFYGGDRHGENLFANCILALDAHTGARKWHYQTVHHDLWDRDLPAPPNLVTVTIDGQRRDAVAQITKSGHIFLLDRDTGEPLHDVVETPVPSSDLEGESAWPTQPIPSRPPPFARERITEADLTRRTTEAHAYAKAVLSTKKEGPPFVPPSLEGSIILPGLDGGGEWGGAAVDEHGVLYINASEMPWILQMVPYQMDSNNDIRTKGINIYNGACRSCHGGALEGGAYLDAPALTNMGSRLSRAEISEIIINGKGQMPGFKYLEQHEVKALTAFLLDIEEVSEDVESTPSDNQWKYPYTLAGYKKFLDQDGFPAITPPWGTLNAIDLSEGTIKWKKTLGHHPDLPQDAPPSGVESYGGPVVTAGGLIFIAGTMDGKFRAFDRDTGEVLYETDLPTPGYATPSTYMIDGKQYVVTACGGGKLGSKSGDTYVAFCLPD